MLFLFKPVMLVSCKATGHLCKKPQQVFLGMRPPHDMHKPAMDV